MWALQASFFRVLATPGMGQDGTWSWWKLSNHPLHFFVLISLTHKKSVKLEKTDCKVGLNENGIKVILKNKNNLWEIGKLSCPARCKKKPYS